MSKVSWRISLLRASLYDDECLMAKRRINIVENSFLIIGTKENGLCDSFVFQRME